MSETDPFAGDRPHPDPQTEAAIARHCRTVEEAWRWRERYEMAKGAERERCVDVATAEIDRAIAELRSSNQDLGAFAPPLLRLRESLPRAIRAERAP